MVSSRSRRRLLAALPLGLAAGGCAAGSTAGPAPPASGLPATGTAEPKALVVLAASSLTEAFTALAGAFPGQPGNAGVSFTLSFGASSQLRMQLEQGAPADLFASADTIQMDQAVKAGLIQGPPQRFARNRLTVVVPRDNRAGVHGLADLAKPGLKLVTTAREVPAGHYTRQALAKMAADPQFGAGFDQKVLANVVSEEPNVRQMVTKVQLGEADAGICYTSDVTARAAPDLAVIDIPDRFNTVAEYPIGIAKGAKAPGTAQRFIAYLLSPAGQGMLKKHNLIPIG